MLLQTEMLTEHNKQFEDLENQAKSHALIFRNVPESGNTARQEIDNLFGLLTKCIALGENQITNKILHHGLSMLS